MLNAIFFSILDVNTLRQSHKLVTFFLNKELQPRNSPYFYCRQVQKVYFSFQSIQEDCCGFHGSNSRRQ